jgi:hypothetical protein
MLKASGTTTAAGSATAGVLRRTNAENGVRRTFLDLGHSICGCS